MNSSDSEEMLMFSSHSSDKEELLLLLAIEEEQAAAAGRSRQCGSVLGHTVIDHRHREGAARLYNDYFTDNPVYVDVLFRRRFRMTRRLFMRIAAAVEQHDAWFRQSRDATGKLGLGPLQKMTAAIRQLAYGVSSDAVDEYVRIGASTAMLALRKFVQAIVELFSDEYLRAPTEADTARLLVEGERRGFPGMLGSIDCMHWVFDFMGEPTPVHRDADQGVMHYVEATQAIRNRAMHHQLRDDLAEHLWSLHGAQ
ncbi:uncharacterized protein LOC133923188 [Phragmites australis]|uniref:uncharacterized protein LOC133923188 n=1 Tax=Phragmites australis TaxID=29695 RepID=UPI002D77979D|nr:uncharacterized protein LOC133923188 [Phragmites australis]